MFYSSFIDFREAHADITGL